MTNTIITTKEQITKAFAEWWRSYEENPSDFFDLGDKGDEKFAEDSAEYFIHLLHQVS